MREKTTEIRQSNCIRIAMKLAMLPQMLGVILALPNRQLVAIFILLRMTR